MEEGTSLSSSSRRTARALSDEIADDHGGASRPQELEEQNGPYDVSSYADGKERREKACRVQAKDEDREAQLRHHPQPDHDATAREIARGGEVTDAEEQDGEDERVPERVEHRVVDERQA